MANPPLLPAVRSAFAAMVDTTFRLNREISAEGPTLLVEQNAHMAHATAHRHAACGEGPDERAHGLRIRKAYRHYTSAAALPRILESKRLWATHTSETNDTSELIHAVVRWKTVINRHAVAATLPEYRALYPPQMMTFDYLRGSKATSFVVCFSGKDDDLPQWGLYADHFKGVAIGFDSSELMRLAHSDVRQNVGFFGVEYAESAQDDFFDWLLTLWERQAAPALEPGLLSSRNPFLYMARWFGPLATSALSVFVRMKEPSFYVEDEWRLAHLHSVGIPSCCEAHSGLFKTHVDLDLGQLAGRLPIVAVLLGPAISNTESVARVREVLLHHGYEVPVDGSRKPLRIEQQIVDLVGHPA